LEVQAGKLAGLTPGGLHMMNTITKYLGLGLALAIGTSACAELEDPAELQNDEVENVASVEQAASWGVFASWARQDNLPTSSNYADLGPDTDRSCFLTGVNGNLSSSYGAQQPSGTLYTGASSRVFRSGGRWTIEAFTGSGFEKIKTGAMCVNITAGRIGPFGWAGGAAKKIGPATAKRRCFLTEVSNGEMYYNDTNFTDINDRVQVWSDGTSWWIGGNGNAAGAAMCVDVTEDLGEWNWANGTTNLAYNDQNPGTQCFLTGVRGVFRTNSYSNGVNIGYNAGLNQYTISASSGKRGWARCIK
jgi:hypothetical protein